MKATGIVRRIDDLGRVVVPKEIRRTLRIREGDPLEIFTDKEGEIILKKYSPIGELSHSPNSMQKVCRRCWDVWQESVIWIRWSQWQETGRKSCRMKYNKGTRRVSEGKKDAECKSRRKKICAGGEQNRTLQSGGDQSDPVCGGCDRGGTPAEHGSERPV